ncbi:efflux RND transporter permease subunit [Nocardioides jiangxiensis]|uniref:Efflux RND transporter permease subunit n=1 Tax=Nocardioides jiangxiensis TaxID=3064524 RepID=A0ABT9AZU8_9ACTN|nr:efflux RND transporter permease subunit [Nocardioides sp. WY-20]MDO7867923.1 efflux RND transporter permease subunit [Nocardioides sp. WY-20]
MPEHMENVARLAVRRAPLVILLWLAVIVGLNTAVPQLEDVIARDNTAFVPGSAASIAAYRHMDDAFGTGTTNSVVFVAGERTGGLTAADRRWFGELAQRIRAQDTDVTQVADLGSEQIWKGTVSRDGEAVYLQVGFPGQVGTPQSAREIHELRDTVAAHVPDGLSVAVTGPAATITDTQDTIEHDLGRITAITLGLIAVIVLLLYRSWATLGVILGFIGACLGAGRGIAATAGHLGWFHVSTFTASMLTAIVLGAATDYAIFLLSRFHELRREGHEPREAAEIATRRVGSIIVGSAVTVVLATAAMGLAQIGFFNTVGPAIALAVTLSLFLSLTLLPAVIALLAPRGWLDPRPARGGAGGASWAGVAAYVVANPAKVLALGLLPLVLLASVFPLMDLGYDQRRVQPHDTESNIGYRLLADHYPANEVLADYVLITSDHDMRNARDIAAIEQAAGSVARLRGVQSVRTISRPLGTPIKQASLGYQMGVAGKRLGKASDQVTSGVKDASRLDRGAAALSSGAGRVASGASRAVDGADRLLAGADELSSGLSRLAAGADDAHAGSARLRAGAARLADGLEDGLANAQLAVDGLGMAYDALKTRSLTCNVDPACRKARDGIYQIWVGERDQLIPGLRDAVAGARAIADGSTDLESGLARIQAGLDKADAGAAQLRAGQATMADKLGDLSDGAGKVADGAGRVADGTGQIAGRMGDLGTGLGDASAYLSTTARATGDTSVGGFYLPPAAFNDKRFALARGLFMSADGHEARMVVVGATDAFGNASLDRTRLLRTTTQDALSDGPLAGASVESAGMPSSLDDIRHLSTNDFRLVAAIALAVVLLVLLVLLRSVVAAVFLLGTVVLSYAAAMGLGTLVWQILLDKPLDWSVPSVAFVILAAVGADYNMLLIKRIHEEAPDGSPAGVARALAVTGSVITAAGLIFAASVFAMMSGHVVTLMQVGFTIGMGLLLDTFVVRTLVVPAFAALVGPRLWWPAAPRAH